MEDVVLIERCLEGDKDALVELISRYKDEYYKLAYIYMKNEHDAMDALEDMILTIYQNIRKLRKLDSFKPWSKTILVNICKGKIKHKRKHVSIEEVGELACEEGKDVHTSIVVKDSLEKLRPKYLEIIKLRYYADMDYETISKVLKIPKGTVKSRLSNGIRKLRDIIGGEIHE